LASKQANSNNKAQSQGTANGNAVQRKRGTKNAKVQKGQEDKADNTRKYVAVIAAIIIIFIFAGAIVYGVRSQPPQSSASLSTFESNFNAANAIGVYATYNTNSSYASAIECSVQLTEAIAGNSPIHKTYDQIHYFIINQTSCTSATLGPNATTSVGPISNCTAFSATHPSIFVNYSTVSKTVITPKALYFYGNSTHLMQCGIASQVS